MEARKLSWDSDWVQTLSQQKQSFFDTFFTKWLRGSTLPMLRQAKYGQRVAPLVTALPQALN